MNLGMIFKQIKKYGGAATTWTTGKQRCKAILHFQTVALLAQSFIVIGEKKGEYSEYSQHKECVII